MSKRLGRISSPQLPAQLQSLLNQEITAVLNNGKTYFGTLASFNESNLVIEDTRSHPHTLAISELYEVVYDANSALNINS
ncbi:LSM domain-containing protein [Dyadobacter crusticola]|uniref:LSM domain-containing protein n=1 Tax=Dyadobacter crusticola TaxID=292407 RepID=UPI0004E1A5B3|nr:LSM domain-containing protein [Dyadobacter crusticola]